MKIKFMFYYYSDLRTFPSIHINLMSDIFTQKYNTLNIPKPF